MTVPSLPGTLRPAHRRSVSVAGTLGYSSLRGLIYAPAGLLNAASPLLDDRGVVREWISLTIFLAVIVATLAAWSFYRRRFGIVRYSYSKAQVAWMTVGGIAYFAGMLAIRGPHAASVQCAWWAAFYLGCYLVPYRLRAYSLWFAALFLVLGFLTQAGVLPNEPFLPGGSRAGETFIWMAFALHGLLDHLLLLRLLPRATPDPATVPNA